MTDLERLDEALGDMDVGMRGPNAAVWSAARAYRDLVANGERVEWCEVHGAPSWDGRDLFCMAGPGDSEERSCLMISRLLVDPPKEEE